MTAKAAWQPQTSFQRVPPTRIIILAFLTDLEALKLEWRRCSGFDSASFPNVFLQPGTQLFYSCFGGRE